MHLKTFELQFFVSSKFSIWLFLSLYFSVSVLFLIKAANIHYNNDNIVLCFVCVVNYSPKGMICVYIDIVHFHWAIFIVELCLMIETSYVYW